MKLREVTTRVGLCLALAFVSTFTIANAAQNDTQSKNTRSIPIAPVKIIPRLVQLVLHLFKLHLQHLIHLQQLVKPIMMAI